MFIVLKYMYLQVTNDTVRKIIVMATEMTFYKHES